MNLDGNDPAQAEPVEAGHSHSLAQGSQALGLVLGNQRVGDVDRVAHDNVTPAQAGAQPLK